MQCKANKYYERGVRNEVFRNSWKNLNTIQLKSFIDLLSGVYKYRSRSTECLWDTTTGRDIFESTMA